MTELSPAARHYSLSGCEIDVCLRPVTATGAAAYLTVSGLNCATAPGHAHATSSVECAALAAASGEVFAGNAGGDMYGCMRWQGSVAARWDTDTAFRLGFPCLFRHSLSASAGVVSLRRLSLCFHGAAAPCVLRLPPRFC